MLIQISTSRIISTAIIFAFVGIYSAKYINISQELLIILLFGWIYLLCIGQSALVELIASCFVAFLLGYQLFEITQGEAWLKFGPLSTAYNTLADTREYLSQIIINALGETKGSLMSGIILGNKVPLEAELLTTFRNVGLSHLIAVSGYNLTVISQNINSLFNPLIGRRAVYISLIVIVLFILLSGAPASVLRAGSMSFLLAFATLSGKQSKGLYILLVGSLLLVIFQPKLVFDIGFQLSVSATYGLVRLSPLINILLQKIPGPKAIYSIISETLSATILTAPILMLYFGQLSSLGLITNILVLPVIPLLMACGIFALGASLVFVNYSSIFFACSWPLLQWIISVAKYTNTLFPNLSTIEISTLQTIIVLTVLVFTIEVISTKVKS